MSDNVEFEWSSRVPVVVADCFLFERNGPLFVQEILVDVALEGVQRFLLHGNEVEAVI